MTMEQDRQLVAVRDGNASDESRSERYRLGIQSAGPAAEFVLGDTAAGGQNFPWIYLKSNGATYEIDLLEDRLTVVIRPEGAENVQVVVYKIDSAAMKGRSVRCGEPLGIVFDYDTVAEDQTTPVDGWVATTGPRYVEELRTRLKEHDKVVEQVQADVKQAQEAGLYGEAARAPRSARPLSVNGETVFAPPAEELVEETPTVESEAVESDIDLDEPEAVQILDPLTGTTYLGRRWRRGTQTTLRNLQNASYRVAVLNLHNGESATVVLNHESNLPRIELTTSRGTIKALLTTETWDAPLEPGRPVDLGVKGALKGSRSFNRSSLPLPVVEELTATGPPARDTVDFPQSSALKKLRSRMREIEGHGIERSHSAA